MIDIILRDRATLEIIEVYRVTLVDVPLAWLKQVQACFLVSVEAVLDS